MTDLQRAAKALGNHSLCLCKGETLLFSDSKGIAPMMHFLAEGKDLAGYSAADIVVGKAAAMLFVKAGVCAVHAVVLSRAGKAFLERHGVHCTWETLCSHITNRNGDGLCPMEQTVAAIEESEQGYTALLKKTEELRNRQNETC